MSQMQQIFDGSTVDDHHQQEISPIDDEKIGEATDRITFQEVIFKYCRIVNSIPQREDSYEIYVQNRSIKDGVAQYKRVDIIAALQRDGVLQLQSLKYYDCICQSWRDVPQKLFIQLRSAAAENSYLHQKPPEECTTLQLRHYALPPLIIELLIKENMASLLHQQNSSSGIITPYNPTKRGRPTHSQIFTNQGNAIRDLSPQIRIVNPSIQDEIMRKIESLESEVIALKNRVSTLEKQQDPGKQPLLSPQLSNIDMDHSMISGNPEDHKHQANDFFCQQNLQKQRSDNSSPPIDLQEYKSFKLICHKCHSQIIKEDNHLLQKNEAEPREYDHIQEGRKHTKSTDHPQFPSSQGDQSRTNKPKLSNRKDCDDSYDSGQDSSSEKSSDGVYDNDDVTSLSFSPNRTTHSSRESKKKLDMAFLYSDPLMQLGDKGKLVPVSQTIQLESEFHLLCRYLSENNKNKQFIVKREAANYATLDQIIQEKPTIIHISCHGSSYFEDGKNTFYLAFESANERGMLDRFCEKRLLELLGGSSDPEAEYRPCPVKLVFVSACHSEKIGQLFKRANVPIVIAVNQHSMIWDDVAVRFTKHFYDQLLKGQTPRKSFKHAKNMIKINSDKANDKFSCCCAHAHTNNCKWFKYAEREDVGEDKGCELHMPDCICPNRWTGLHQQKCPFLKKFQQTLQIAQYTPIEEMSSDPTYDSGSVQNPNHEVMLCCCNQKTPHDEIQKIIIIKRSPTQLADLSPDATLEEKKRYEQIKKNDQEASDRDEKMLDTPLFKNKKEKQDRGLFIKDNMQQHYNMPYFIDQLQVQGRNLELMEIIKHLDYENDKKLIHIYGADGVGKTAIASTSAKYALDRRFFPQGVYYIDLLNKNQEHKFIDAIYEKLFKLSNIGKSLEDSNSTALTNLIQTIKSSQMLIVIDNCQELIATCKDFFNNALIQISQLTQEVKIIVVTDQKNDIKKSSSMWQIEIKELGKSDAAQLLWTAAKSSPKFLKDFKNKAALQKHKFFGTQTTFNPNRIITIASFLKEGKSLDEITLEQEKAKQKEEAKRQEGIQSLHNEEAYCWTTSITFTQVQSRFPTEIKLLYILCQFPHGLFASDIESLCKEIVPAISDWKNFIESISQEVKQTMNDQLTEVEDHQNKGLASRGSYKILTSKLIDELQEYHYIPLPKFTEYINVNVLNEIDKREFFFICLKHISVLSRSILRGIKEQYQNAIDISIVSAEIDVGIWSEYMTYSDEHIQYSVSTLLKNAGIRIKFIEQNLTSYLDVRSLKTYITKLDNKSEYLHYITELCINTCSIFVLIGHLQDAGLVIKKALDIASFYNLKFLKACLILIECSRLIKLNGQHNYIAQNLSEARGTFKQLEMSDGIADTQYLQGISLLNSVQIKVQQIQQASMAANQLNAPEFQSSLTPHSIQRTSSQQFQSMNGSLHALTSINRKQSSNNASFTQGFFGSMQHSNTEKEIENALKMLNSALETFQEMRHEYGIGKCSLVLAEFYLEKSYGTGIDVEVDPKFVKLRLKQAVQNFKSLNLKSLEARSLKLMAIYYERYANNLLEAKKYIVEAKTLCEQIQDIPKIAICNQLLNDILDQIRINSNNVFIFAKAFPLVEQNGKDNCKVVGAFTKHSNDFRTRLKKGLDECKKIINVKFDILTRDLLDYIRNIGCRVLHLSSDVYRDDCLCIEGNNGLIEFITTEQLKILLKPPHQEKLQVDLVVLAIPDCQKLAEVFVGLGVPHVVAFNFKKKIDPDSFMDSVYILPRRYNIIYNFCVNFYLAIINEQTVASALLAAKKEFHYSNDDSGDSEDDREIDQFHYNSKQSDSIATTPRRYGPILLPIHQLHNYKLFDSKSSMNKMRIKPGPLLDSSKIRGRTNVVKPITPFTGRQTQMYQIMNYLQNPLVHLVNLYGLSGIGKTRFVIEIAYYMHARVKFNDGIFIVDLANVKLIEHVKQKLRDKNITGQDVNADLQNKNVLLIFDNIDNILKNNKTQFDWFIVSLVQQCQHVKVILTSKKAIRPKDYSSIKVLIRVRKLEPLNPIEAADLILSYVAEKREITKEELDMEEDCNRTVHTQLQQEAQVQRCFGFPRYLEQFANLLKQYKFHQIQIQHVIPIPKSQQEKMEKYRQSQSESGVIKVQGKANVINKETHIHKKTDSFKQQSKINKQQSLKLKVKLPESVQLRGKQKSTPENPKPLIGKFSGGNIHSDIIPEEESESLPDSGQLISAASIYGGSIYKESKYDQKHDQAYWDSQYDNQQEDNKTFPRSSKKHTHNNDEVQNLNSSVVCTNYKGVMECFNFDAINQENFQNKLGPTNSSGSNGSEFQTVQLYFQQPELSRVQSMRSQEDIPSGQRSRTLSQQQYESDMIYQQYSDQNHLGTDVAQKLQMEQNRRMKHIGGKIEEAAEHLEQSLMHSALGARYEEEKNEIQVIQENDDDYDSDEEDLDHNMSLKDDSLSLSELKVGQLQRLYSKHSSLTTSSGKLSDALSLVNSTGSGGGIKRMKSKKEEAVQAQIKQELGPRSGRSKNKFAKNTKNKLREIRTVVKGDEEVIIKDSKEQRKQGRKDKKLEKRESVIQKDYNKGVIAEEGDTNIFDDFEFKMNHQSSGGGSKRKNSSQVDNEKAPQKVLISSFTALPKKSKSRKTSFQDENDS